MPLTEHEAAKIVLIRSVEECDKTVFTDSLLVAATVGSKTAATGLGWVKQRADFLYDHLPGRYRSMLHLANIPTPWTLPICITAIILGMATNLLGPADKIHVVRNPVLLLVAWNLLIYFSLLVMFLLTRRKASRIEAGSEANLEEQQREEISASLHSRDSGIIRFLLPGFYRLLLRATGGLHSTKTLSDVVRRFSVHWMTTAGSLVSARWSCLLHLGSLCLATGAVAGMYFRGLFQGYDVIWDSTFLTQEHSVARFLAIIFSPGFFLSDLLGLGLAESTHVPRLLTPAGDEAAGWIHLFALTVLIAIVIPRAILASWEWRKIDRLRKRINVVIDSYYGEVIEAPIRATIEQNVAEEAGRFSQSVAEFVTVSLYDEKIVPLLRAYRREGGKIADLKTDLNQTTDSFLPELNSFITEVGVPDIQTALGKRISTLLQHIETEFIVLEQSQASLERLTISAPKSAATEVSRQLNTVLSLTVGATIAVTFATIGGGIGHHIGIAVVATVLGTSGPIGFVIGFIGGAVVTAGVWWYGKERITEAIETVPLPASLLRIALWESRFEKLVEAGRTNCTQSVKTKIDEMLTPLRPKISEEILFGLRRLWSKTA